MINQDMHCPVYTPQEVILYSEVMIEKLKNVDMSRKDLIEQIRATQNQIIDVYSS